MANVHEGVPHAIRLCIYYQTHRTFQGMFLELKAPSDPKKLVSWAQSESMTLSIIMVYKCSQSAPQVHPQAHEGALVEHIQQDASLCYVAWMRLLGIRKTPCESYTDYLNCITDAHNRIDCRTPMKLSFNGPKDEGLVPFVCLCGLHGNGPNIAGWVHRKTSSSTILHEPGQQGHWHDQIGKCSKC